MAAAAEREKLLQLRALNEFLAKLTALDDGDKRFDKYVEVFNKLHSQQRTEQRKLLVQACKRGDLGDLVQKIANWRIGNPAHQFLSKERPISYGQRDFFEAFGVFVEKDLREVAVNRSWCRNCPPDSKSYNTQLIARIDTYLSSLDTFMLLQAQADTMTSYGSFCFCLPSLKKYHCGPGTKHLTESDSRPHSSRQRSTCTSHG
jgi:hypothetical protein